jgi:hypothetical protein
MRVGLLLHHLRRRVVRFKVEPDRAEEQERAQRRDTEQPFARAEDDFGLLLVKFQHRIGFATPTYSS